MFKLTQIKQQITSLSKKKWVEVLLFTLLWRFLLLVLMAYAIGRIHEPAQNFVIDASILLKGLFKGDAHYFLIIAQQGYGKVPNGLPVFFPLFPLTVKLFHHITHFDFYVSGLILTSLFSYIAFYFLYLIAHNFFNDSKKAWLVVGLFAFSPASYFLSAFYSESLYCALAFGTFYYAIKRRWLFACLLAMLATSTRLAGVLVAGGIFIEYLASVNFSFKRIKWEIGYFALTPLGIFAYMFYLHYQFHDWLFFLHAYKYGWSYQKFTPNIFQTIWVNVSGIISTFRNWGYWQTEGLGTSILFFGSWVGALGITIWGARKVKLSFTIFSLSTLLFIVLDGNFISHNRYILPLFPLYLILIAKIKNETFVTFLVASCACMMGLMLTLYSNGYWTG
jgi:Gpi18-like mannosyltransferase